MRIRTGLAGLLLCLPLVACQYHTSKTDSPTDVHSDQVLQKSQLNTSELTSSPSKSSAAMADHAQKNRTPKGIRIIPMKNPKQPFEMAAKVQWNPHDKRWNKVLVLYNGHPKPPAKHPVWDYLKALRIPKRQANHAGENLAYKAFSLQAYCRKKNALSHYKPMYINFDQHDEGEYSEYAFKNDWFCPTWQMGRQQIQVKSGGRNQQGKALYIKLPQYAAGCGQKKCLNWKPKLGGKFHALEYSYWVKFADNFDFVRGGKLPGIGNNHAATGGNKATGENGWSIRVMWNHDGKLGQYVYYPDQHRRYGDFFPWDAPAIRKGQWYQIKTQVHLNKAGQRNGTIKTWLNGRLVLNKTDLRFQNADNLPIERLLFSVFYGGNDHTWAPKRDNYLWIDDWIIRPL